MPAILIILAVTATAMLAAVALATIRARKTGVQATVRLPVSSS